MKVIIGYGECEDCGWYHDPEGCNVERDSSICRLNRRLKSAEWQKQISQPRIPVMPKYNIVDGIINMVGFTPELTPVDIGQLSVAEAGITMCHN